MSERGSRFYLPQLDGLRFFAFLSVFLHHSPLFPDGSRAAAFVHQLGWVGVDLFLVLSAYLLVSLLHREYAATGTVSFSQFFIRRALRIWPLFYFYVGVCFLYFVLFDSSGGTAVAGRTIGHLFFVDNVFTAITDQYNPLNFTPHLWTIAFEEQVYILMPLLFMAIVGLKNNRKFLVLATAAVFLSQPLLRLAVNWFYAKERVVWVMPFAHFDTISAGLLLGTVAGTRMFQRVPGDLFAVIGAAVFGLMFFVAPGGDFAMFLPDRNVFMFTFLAFAFSFIVLGCLDATSWLSRLLALQPFVFLGRISYGLYVWHWAGNQFAPPLASPWLSAYMTNEVASWFAVVVPALSLTVVLAVLSYYVLERPFLRIKSRFTLVVNRPA